ncbi:hypothetical protein O4158_23765, partial [Gordonia amicalis]|uniref:hypothetical protein n=1 Tax=Gordonia amicalis TaxID=89053 RepID=UPI0022B586F7
SLASCSSLSMPLRFGGNLTFREVVEGLAQSQIARAKRRELAATKPKQPKPVNKPKTPHTFHGIDITDWTPEQKSKLRPWVPMGWDGNSEWNEDGTKRIGWTPFLPGWDLESVVKLGTDNAAH